MSRKTSEDSTSEVVHDATNDVWISTLTRVRNALSERYLEYIEIRENTCQREPFQAEVELSDILEWFEPGGRFAIPERTDDAI